MGESKANGSPFSKLMQVGVVVKDMDKAIEKLSALGIGPFETRILPPERQEWFRGKSLDATPKISIAMMGDIQLELIEPADVDSPHKEFLDNKGEGIQHLGFAVGNVQEEVEKLIGQGKDDEVLLRAKFPGGGGVAYLDLGVGNIIVELIQR